MSASTTADVISPPTAAEFDNQANAYIDAPELLRIAEQLIARDPHLFSHLQGRVLTCLWKGSGGKDKGRARLGGVTKATDLHRLTQETDVFVWVAADHAREQQLTWRQLEAAVFSLLCRITEDKNGLLVLVGPEFEAFEAELAAYGAWNHDLERMRAVFTQQPLPL